MVVIYEQIRHRSQHIHGGGCHSNLIWVVVADQVDLHKTVHGGQLKQKLSYRWIAAELLLLDALCGDGLLVIREAELLAYRRPSSGLARRLNSAVDRPER